MDIKEIANQQGFSGNRFHKHADFVVGRQYTVDESSYGPKVNTSIDCYVTGMYTGSKGNSISIKQRYTVYVSYTKQTQMQALTKIRAQIMTDFEQNFPQFKVSDVFIPEQQMPVPAAAISGDDNADMYYGGSELYKRISGVDVGRFRVGTERMIFDSRVKKIKKQFGLR